MKTLRILTMVIATISFVSVVHSQSSQPLTITLNVPLQLTDLHPDVDHIRVIGYAYDDASSSHPCATGTLDIPCPSNGDIRQTAAVELTQIQGFDITRALSYSVTFNIFTKSGSMKNPSESASIEARPKEGTPFTPIVRGEVRF
jgi:hypothetical protein